MFLLEIHRHRPKAEERPAPVIQTWAYALCLGLRREPIRAWARTRASHYVREPTGPCCIGATLPFRHTLVTRAQHLARRML